MGKKHKKHKSEKHGYEGNKCAHSERTNLVKLLDSFVLKL